MKYDRPVWQIMHACADAMPPVFRYDDVRTWFASHYPDVNEATIRAHLIGLTEGGRTKHVQFAQRSPVFRRVARGEYSAIPLADRGETPDVPAPSREPLAEPGLSAAATLKMSGNGTHLPSDDVDATADAAVGATPEPAAGAPRPDDPASDVVLPDVVLVGSIGDRVNVPAPAKEVFREVSFQLSRLDAELSGVDWFVLSAEHGLVAPDEWISPDSRTLVDMEPDYRIVWATWVVARLQSLVGPVGGMLVRVDAPSEFIGPLFQALEAQGAVLTTAGVAGFPVPAAPEPATAPEPPAAHEPAAEPEPEQQVPGRSAQEQQAVQQIVPEPRVVTAPPAVEPARPGGGAGSRVAAHLADVSRAIPAAEAASLPATPGLYGWVVDASGARELNRSLQLPVRPGLVFVGQVGGSSWHSLVDPMLNLRDHLDRVQLRGRTRASTFRMTLATVLRAPLGMTSVEDRRLTAWMLEHLSITTWPDEEGEGLRELAQVVIAELDPPLNVDHLPASQYRARLQQLRDTPA